MEEKGDAAHGPGTPSSVGRPAGARVAAAPPAVLRAQAFSEPPLPLGRTETDVDCELGARRTPSAARWASLPSPETLPRSLRPLFTWASESGCPPPSSHAVACVPWKPALSPLLPRWLVRRERALDSLSK